MAMISNIWRNAFSKDLLAMAEEGTNGTVRTVSRFLSGVSRGFGVPPQFNI